MIIVNIGVALAIAGVLICIIGILRNQKSKQRSTLHTTGMCIAVLGAALSVYGFQSFVTVASHSRDSQTISELSRVNSTMIAEIRELQR